MNRQSVHCVKSVQIRSFFWSVFSHIRTEYGKIRTGKNSVFGHFSLNAWITEDLKRTLDNSFRFKDAYATFLFPSCISWNKLFKHPLILNNIFIDMFFPVHTLTRNELEQAWTTWNKLELPRTSWNQAKRAWTRCSQQRLALERVMRVFCRGSC